MWEGLRACTQGPDLRHPEDDTVNLGPVRGRRTHPAPLLLVHFVPDREHGQGEVLWEESWNQEILEVSGGVRATISLSPPSPDDTDDGETPLGDTGPVGPRRS